MKNNKGFMMAELIVVASVVIVTMVAFYASYSKILARYNKIVYYYDVGTIYRLGHYYSDNNNKEEFKKATKVKVKDIPQETINGVIYDDKIYYGQNSYIKAGTFESSISGKENYEEYVKYLTPQLETNPNKQTIILESCQKKNDTTRCKFAYIEVNHEEPTP